MARTTISSFDRAARSGWRAVCTRDGWWLIWAGLAAALAIREATPGALASLGAGPAGLLARLAGDWPAALAQLSAFAAAAAATAQALDVRPRVLLPSSTALLLAALVAGPAPEVPLSALLVGLFLAGPPARELGAEQALEAGTLLLALACPALLAAGAGPAAALHATAVAAVVCGTAWLVTNAILRLDRRVTSGRHAMPG
jgi:hypothetical protein